MCISTQFQFKIHTYLSIEEKFDSAEELSKSFLLLLLLLLLLLIARN